MSEETVVEEGGLSVFKRENLPTAPTYNKNAMARVDASEEYLPYLQLFGSNSKLVKSKKATAGNYGICQSSEKFKDIGDTFACVPLCWRFKALDTNGDDESDVIAVYDVESDEFKRIEEAASESGMNGCLCGREFLLYIGDGHNTFVTWFAANKSAKRVANELVGYLEAQQNVVFSSDIAENKKKGYVWEVPVVESSEQDIPIPAKAGEILKKFIDEAESKEDSVPEATAARER